MISFNRVYKWSLGYALLKIYVNFTQNVIFYKSVHLVNTENLPLNEPVIIASNHQNTLMDALAINHNIPGQNVFLARSDIFGNPIIARILRFLKLMPIYRIQDGKEALQNNDDIFRIAVNALRSNKRIILFPEGTHSPYRKLRPLKKGVARIAFQSAQKMNYERDIKIVPVGLDYTDFQKSRETLTVTFGKPVSLAEYYDQYRDNPRRTMVQFTNTINEKIRPLMLNIPSREFYNTIDTARKMFSNDVIDWLHYPDYKRPTQIAAEQKIADALADKENEENQNFLRNFSEKIFDYTRLLRKLRISNSLLRNRTKSVFYIISRLLILLILSPVFIYGFINNIVVYYIPQLAVKNLKDRQFESSIKFVIYSFVSPVIYLLQLFVFSIFVEDFWYRLFYLVSLPVTGYLAYSWYISLQKCVKDFRYYLYDKLRNKDLKQVNTYRSTLAYELYSILEK